MRRDLLAVMIVVGAGCGSQSPSAPSSPAVSFFVTSATSTTGNLGGPDRRGRDLPAAGGGRRPRIARLARVSQCRAGRRRTTTCRPTPAIGSAPARGTTRTSLLVANNVAELHAKTGDPAVFVDERGQRINGQWPGSPGPNQHDILTGSNADGTLADRVHVCGLDVRLGEPSPPKSATPTAWGPAGAPLGRSRRGTRRTRARVAPIPRRVAEPGGSTASRGRAGAACGVPGSPRRLPVRRKRRAARARVGSPRL